MGIGDALNSAKDALGLWLPDRTSATDACRAVYGAGWAAAGAIDTTARAGATRARDVLTSAADNGAPHVSRINDAIPPRDAWMRAALSLTDHFLAEASKPYFGPLYNIGKKSLFNAPPPKEKAVAELQRRVERLEAILEPPPKMAASAQKPEDVIPDFMLKGFNAADLLDTPWWLPHIGKSKQTDI